MNYKELKNTVLKHNELYYDKSAPIITDAEWDRLYDTLERTEAAQGWADFDSPTMRVGGKAGKVTHPFRLYSLKKVYDKDEIDTFFDVETPKIDGTNLTLVYKRGKLYIALVRGDGERGDNVIHLAKHISNIPKRVSTEFEILVVNGECVTLNDVDNYRNYVSGSLGLKDAEEFKNRNINFIAHDWLGAEMNYLTRMKIIKNMGFATVLDNSAWDYPRDGVVYRINDYKKCVDLGYTSKYPRFAIALKEREAEVVATTLQDVVWVVGRTGTVNPTGIVDPVYIEDALISRVTLHNIGIIEEHNLGLGDIIEIERAGGVIPKFLRVVEHSKHNIKITEAHAQKITGLKTKRDGPRLLVADKSNNNSIKGLEHFIKIMKIKGLGPASVKKLGLTHPLDLYKNNNWDILGANGAKIIDEIERSKMQPYSVVLTALGIPGVGKSAAELIINTIPTFDRLRSIDLYDIKGVGPATVRSILTWLDENEEWVTQLPLNFEQSEVKLDISDNKKKVCITGKLDMSRSELSDMLTDIGFQVTSTVTKDCYALISGGDNSSSKYKKAVSNNVQIVDYWKDKKSILKGEF